jgi:RNase adaptor protein for sRNA GlmZ degradation
MDALTLLGYYIAFNLCFSLTGKFLDIIKNKTETKIDNNLAIWFNYGARKTKKYLDFLGNNTPHNK